MTVRLGCVISIIAICISLILPVCNGASTSPVCKNGVCEASIEVQYKRVEDIKNTHIRFAAYYRNGGGEWKKLSVQDWAQLLSSKNDRSPQLASELTEVIVEACPSYGAFFFETKGVSSTNASEKQFEFVLVESNSFKGIEANPDPNAFKEHLNCSSSKTTKVCSFWNLGRSAKLIAPRQQDGKQLKTYSHLAPFLRGASKEHNVQMWGVVVDEYLKIMKEWDGEPVWLSTAGLGVAWLHVRLDKRPKYYSFKTFAKEK